VVALVAVVVVALVAVVVIGVVVVGVGRPGARFNRGCGLRLIQITRTSTTAEADGNHPDGQTRQQHAHSQHYVISLSRVSRADPIGSATSPTMSKPICSFIACTRQELTGTKTNVINSIVIPPKDGVAMGTITSLPRPVLVNTGIRARIVVAVVIRQGRILRKPAWRPLLYRP
jgi:hypothetical protein